MGFRLHLVDRNKSITKEIVKHIIENEMPKRLKGVFPSEQDWGWSLVNDLTVEHNKENNISYLDVSGSFSVSGQWALDMVLFFQQALQKRGFHIEVESEDFGFRNLEIYEWLGNDPTWLT